MGGNPNVLIAIPEIQTFKINNKTDFLCMGSDGIFEKIQNKDIIQTIWTTTSKEIRKQSLNFHEIMGECTDLILKKSIIAGSLDNISWVIISFNNFIEKSKTLNNRLLKLPKSCVLDVHLNRAISRTYGVKKRRHQNIDQALKKLETVQTENK